MKSQSGITLVSIAIYIVLIFVVLAILATVTSNFQRGVQESNVEGTEIAEINKFNMYFLQEVKKQGNEIVEISESKNEITFSLGNKYVFDSNNGVISLIELNEEGIASKSIVISKNIEECSFSKKNEDGKNVVIVNIKAENTDKITNEYVLISQVNNSNYEDQKDYIY